VSFRIPAFRRGTWRRRPSLRALRHEAGFTLVELMVSLSVMAIIMAIAIPTVATHMALQEIRGSTQQVVDVLRDARDSAMNEGQPRYVLFEPGTPGGYEVWRYNGSAWVQEEEELLHDSVSFSNTDVDFPELSNRPETGAQVPLNAAYFDTRGHYPFGSAPTFTLTLHGRMDKTEVLTLYSQTGQVVWE
jgi:prepilin-type N-terminal cleavage/methylation domain-containing protein